MGNVNIIKCGLKQTVSQEAFKKQYAPNGWIIDDTETALDETQETVKTFADENQIKNYLKMKKREPKKFNDGLFKSGT